NKPAIRFIEGLLYRSRYYVESLQSTVLFHGKREGRKFVLSSPKLKDDEQVHIRMPFKSIELDELFKARYEPQPLPYLRSILGVENEQADLFSSFFTKEEPPVQGRYAGQDVRIRYFGHACLLIETKEVSILCDPLISYEEDSSIHRYTYADLPAE